MTRDYQKWPGEGDIPVLCGNVEGADLKNNSQSTTHIIANFWLQNCTSLIQTFGKAGKHRHLPARNLTSKKRFILVKKKPLYRQTKNVKLKLFRGGRGRLLDVRFLTSFSNVFMMSSKRFVENVITMPFGNEVLG